MTSPFHSVPDKNTVCLCKFNHILSIILKYEQTHARMSKLYSRTCFTHLIRLMTALCICLTHIVDNMSDNLKSSLVRQLRAFENNFNQKLQVVDCAESFIVAFQENKEERCMEYIFLRDETLRAVHINEP